MPIIHLSICIVAIFFAAQVTRGLLGAVRWLDELLRDRRDHRRRDHLKGHVPLTGRDGSRCRPRHRSLRTSTRHEVVFTYETAPDRRLAMPIPPGSKTPLLVRKGALIHTVGTLIAHKHSMYGKFCLSPFFVLGHFLCSRLDCFDASTAIYCRFPCMYVCKRLLYS